MIQENRKICRFSVNISVTLGTVRVRSTYVPNSNYGLLTVI